MTVDEIFPAFLTECQTRLPEQRVYIVLISHSGAVQAVSFDTGSLELQPLTASSSTMTLPLVIVAVSPESGRTVTARVGADGSRTLN